MAKQKSFPPETVVDPVTEQPEQTSAEAEETADRVAELEAENARLREQLAATGQTVGRARPTEPSFVFSEGQRQELEATGRTVSPFTGQRYVGTGPDDVREATAEEFARAKPAKPNTGKKS